MTDQMTIREFTRQYCERDNRLASVSYFGTFAAYFATLYLALQFYDVWWLVGPLVVINALSGVRLYVLEHDCGHQSLFTERWMNDWAGYGVSTFTLTPYRMMQHNHNEHHKYLGDLEQRRSGEIHTMTLSEWQQAGFWQRLGYRLYRNPLFLIPVGGIFVYALRYRWPKNTWKIAPVGVIIHDVLLLVWVVFLYYVAGVPGLLVYGATVLVAAFFGVFLVYLQHNFEDTYWDHRPNLRHDLAALQGSSALDLGWWFDLATANIAYHDIHHFNARIPSYRLRKAHRVMRDIYDLPTINWPEAFRSFTLKLWDEDAGRLVPFPKRESWFGAGSTTA